MASVSLVLNVWYAVDMRSVSTVRAGRHDTVARSCFACYHINRLPKQNCTQIENLPMHAESVYGSTADEGACSSSIQA